MLQIKAVASPQPTFTERVNLSSRWAYDLFVDPTPDGPSDIPVSRAMSTARRYSVPSVMTGSPNDGELTWDDPLPAAAQSIRAQLAAPAGE